MYSYLTLRSIERRFGTVDHTRILTLGRQSLNARSNAAPGTNTAERVAPFMYSIPNQIPFHPDVKLKKLPFYDVLSTLVKPSTLMPRSQQRRQEMSFNFAFTPRQIIKIISMGDIRDSIEIQLRFCLLDTSCEQDDCFPASVCVKVNNNFCQVPNNFPMNFPKSMRQRQSRPINVTSNVKLLPREINTITVKWRPEYTHGYCIAVYIVKKLTSAQLLNQMMRTFVKGADYTRALIKEKLNNNANYDIPTKILKVSLICPLGKMKMSVPCRASTCSHLQCFDAGVFLQMNERNPTWNCPVCDQRIAYNNLVIDEYFQEILTSTLIKADDTELKVSKNGSWLAYNSQHETKILNEHANTVEGGEFISDYVNLTSDDETCIQPIKSDIAIDLTLTDSDDEQPPAKIGKQRKTISP